MQFLKTTKRKRQVGKVWRNNSVDEGDKVEVSICRYIDQQKA